MKKKYIGAVVFIFIISLFILSLLFSEKQVIYTESRATYDFSATCNPCTWKVAFEQEDRFLQDVRFEVSIGEGTYGEDIGCEEILDEQMSCEPSYSFEDDAYRCAVYHPSSFCREKGWQDYGGAIGEGQWCEMSYLCGRYGGANCIGSTIICFKWLRGTPNKVLINNGQILEWYKGNKTTMLTENLADILNSRCEQFILACQEEPGGDLCNSECYTNFEIKSSHNYGYLSVTDYPVCVKYEGEGFCVSECTSYIGENCVSSTDCCEGVCISGKCQLKAPYVPPTLDDIRNWWNQLWKGFENRLREIFGWL